MNQDIWRYLDLTKFIDLLQSRTLKLVRSDLFEDPFEGTINKYTHEALLEAINSNERVEKHSEFKGTYVKFNGTWVNLAQDFKKDEIGKILNNALSCVRKHTFINCWHINKHESEAMWKLYSKNIQEAVVIRSTIKKVSDLSGDDFICKGVDYIDYSSKNAMMDYFIAPFLHKRISFQHENEFRILSQKLPLVDSKSEHMNLDLTASPTSGFIELDLGTEIENLIDEIRISPFAPVWFKNIIKGLIEAYNINIPINDSELALPVFEIES